MTIFKLFSWILGTLIWLVLGTAGCSGEWLTSRIEPETRIKGSAGFFGSSIDIKNTKDVSIDLQGGFNPETGEFRIDQFVLRDMSSPVIDADERRMHHIIEAQRVHVEYLRQLGTNFAMALAAGGDAAEKFLQALPSMAFDASTLVGSGSARIVPIPAPPKATDANDQPIPE